MVELAVFLLAIGVLIYVGLYVAAGSVLVLEGLCADVRLLLKRFQHSFLGRSN